MTDTDDDDGKGTPTFVLQRPHPELQRETVQRQIVLERVEVPWPMELSAVQPPHEQGEAEFI